MQAVDPARILTDMYFKVRQRLAEFNDLAHGWEHVRRVYNLALQIAEREGADRFTVGCATLLHDIGRAMHDEGKHHAAISVEEGRRVLAHYALTTEQVTAILHAIEAHRSEEHTSEL